jgi:PAS domain S-box-containing protein
MRTSIVWKLTLFVGVVVALNTGLLIGVAYIATSAILRDQIHDRLATRAADRQGMLQSALKEQAQRAAALASWTRIRSLLTEHAQAAMTADAFEAEATPILSSVRANTSGVRAVWIEDASGRLLASNGPESLITALSKAERTGARDNGGLLVPPRLTDESHAAVFAGVVKASGESGQIVGAIMLAVDLGPVMAALVDPLGLGDTGEVLVGWKRGDQIRLAVAPRFGPPIAEVTEEKFPSLAAATAGQFGFTRTRDYRSNDTLVAYRPLGADYPGWGLIAKIDSAEAYEPVNRLRFRLLALGGGILLLGLGASNAIARRFARPIRRLARTSAAVAAGDLNARSEVHSSDEIGGLSVAFNRMTEELARSYTTLERRISERTHDLEAVRDLLDAFFRISISRPDPDNIDRTYDSVLRFCSKLGYDLAMISLVDRAAGVIRAVRALGSMTDVVELTVRPLRGNDILAIAVRENRVIVVPDSRSDPSCDQAAIALAEIRGQIVLPLVSDTVLGTLQVASHSILEAERVDLRPLETLASHTARALTGLHQLEEIRRLNQSLEQHAEELARSELALREQTRILQSVLDCMGDGVVVADAEQRFLVFNPAAERIIGHGRTDTPPEDWSRHYELFLPDRVTPYPVQELPIMRAIRGESSDQVELYIAYPSREAGTWILATGRPLRDEHGALEGGVVVFHDITRRKKSERRLAAQYETTRVLAEAESPSQATAKILETICVSLDWDVGAFWRVDSNTQRLRCVALWHRPDVNVPRFEETSRQGPLERGAGLPGRVWHEAQPTWIAEIARDPNFPRRLIAVEEGLHTGFAIPILLRGDCLGVLEFLSRESRPADPATLEMMASLGSQIGQFIERHQMRGRVAQAEKLASLGMLSAGVAHEINNPLAYIANNLAVLERDVRFILTVLAIYEKGRNELAAVQPELIHQVARLSEEFDLPYVKANMGKLLQSTRQGVKRVADIVQNLRGFARLDHAALDRVDIHEALKAALEMVRGRLNRRNIQVEQRLGELPPVAGSPAQLNQVFLNLLVNALQAIEATHRAEGRIAITTHAQNGEVVVEVADDGCGIADEVLPQIFDPFFTTKVVGDGTGLGLSITHGMVQDHGGRLEVESVPGQGTRFRVILPVAGEN